MHDTLTDAQKADLLAMAGVTPEQAEAFDTPTAVADAVADTVKEVKVEKDDSDAARIGADLLKKARGNMDTAKQLSEKWATDEFNRVKLSKVQAAALGLDNEGKSKHNSSEYKRIQAERERINNAMRKLARGHVATKIATKKEASGNPALDAFLLENQGNPLLAQMLELMGGGQ